MKLRHTLFHSGRDGSWRDLGLLIARVGFSGSLIWRHGVSKIPALVADPVEFFDPLGIGPAAQRKRQCQLVADANALLDELDASRKR